MKEYDWSTLLTDRRINKFREIASKRTYKLTVVLENIYDSHNINAVLRSCEGFGIQQVHIIMPDGYSFKYKPSITKKSHKWLDIYFYRKTIECIKFLKENGFTIHSSLKSSKSIPHYEIDVYNNKVALVFGNEKDGISEKMVKHSDFLFWIPMYGFSESLNISVAAAITISRLREKMEDKYSNSFLKENDVKSLVDKWILKDTEKYQGKGGLK